MSHNNKNARLQKAEEALPKNRSAAAKARRKEGKVTTQGRATEAKHGKKRAWWQLGDYSTFVKGKGKRPARTQKDETGVVEVAIENPNA